MENRDRQIAEEIITLQISSKDSLKDIFDKFFSIMRKYGIKKGLQQYNDDGEETGILFDNFEWTLYKQLLFSTLESHINMQTLFGELKPPEDLEK
jgi:hypothetical protein